MVAWGRTDKATGKPYVWRFFGLVRAQTKRGIDVWRIGAEENAARMLLVPARQPEMQITHLEDDTTWPDGIWQIRTQLILDGTIDITKRKL